MVMGHPVEGDNTLAQLAAVRDVRAGGAATVVRLGGQHNSVSPGAGELRNVAGRNVWTLAAFAALFAVGSFGVTWLLLGVLGGGGTQAGTKDAVKDVTRDAPKDNGTPGSGNGTGTGGTNERETRENEAWEQLHAIENTPRVSARDRADDLKRKVVDAYPGTRAADVASRKITELQTEIEREGQKSRAAEIRWRTVVRDLDKYDDDKQKIRLVQNFLANAEFDGTEAAKQARKLLDDLRRKAGPGGLDGESDPTGKTKKRPPLPPVDPVMPVTKGTG